MALGCRPARSPAAACIKPSGAFSSRPACVVPAAAKSAIVRRIGQASREGLFTMPSGHEIGEEIEHVGHENRRIALLVSVLALFLAFAVMGAKSTQTEAITQNLNSANLWVFYQANSIQRRTVQTTAETVEVRPVIAVVPEAEAAKSAQLAAWKKQLARYESDPEAEDAPQQGQKEIMATAREAEHKRDRAMERYHHYEVAAAAFEVGIVLASATVVTGLIILAWIAGTLGIIGFGFLGIATFAPHLLHLF
jgi:hypothetical protein